VTSENGKQLGQLAARHIWSLKAPILNMNG
jgi:hypothetical protein